MAVKQYGYYIKGNKIALVEKDTSFDNDVTSKEYGPGSDRAQWKSPKERVEEGLQIQYTYAPTFNLQSTGTEGTDYHRFLGWGSDGTNLLLFTTGQTSGTASTVADLSSLFLADDWIHIDGSGRWSGLHQVKSNGSATGVLTLKTKCNLKPSKITVAGAFAGSTETFNGTGQDTDDRDIEAFKDTAIARKSPYIFTTGAAATANNGVFQVDLSSETQGEIKFNTQYYLDVDGEIDDPISNGTSQTPTFYNMYYDPMIVRENIEVLTDESFDIQLPDYMCKAIVSYLRARLAEDAGNIEMYEYYMSRFRKQIEEFKAARHSGPKMVSSFWHLR